jgi:hypothetical protein
MDKYFDLPKKDNKGVPYLSYTQISSWFRNKNDYIRSYFYNEPISFTQYIDFGKKVGGALETGDFSLFNVDEVATLKKVPRYDVFEKEVNINFENFYLKGFIDTCDKDFNVIADYKTGTMDKLDQYLEDEYIQLVLYGAGLQQELGKLPEKCQIIFIERFGNPYNGEDLLVGNNVVVKDLEMSEERVTFAKEKVMKAAEEISKYYRIFKQINKN